uniref:hypothetical protein n=1 Tax=Teredinibacter waterburyi TaxID=1500538 RepID=UPI001CAA89E4
GFATLPQNSTSHASQVNAALCVTMKKGYVAMSVVYRALLILCFLFLAIACYVFGVPAGGVVFLLLGLVFEGLFWAGIFGKKKSKSSL